MTGAEAFRRARAALLEHATDLERARAEFVWPDVESFNWAWDWFEPFASGNARAGLVLVSETVGTRAISFAELAERSTRLGRWLVEHGVQRGDRVLVMLGNVQGLWETMLAALKIGAVVIPATTQLTQADVDDRLERGHARHVVTDSVHASKVRGELVVRLAVGGAPGFTSYDDALAAPCDLPRLATRPDDPLLLYFTSGTTAKPKLVLHTHASYPVGHLSTMYWIGLREGDVHHNVSSPGWAKHAWSSFFAPWSAGATIVAHDTPRFSGPRLVEVLREQRVSTLCAPPTVWRMLILEDLGDRPAQLRELASAGEPLNPEVIDTVRRAWGLTLRDGYGQTETTAQVGNPPGLPVREGSMGRPLPGYEVALLDGEGRPGDEGEVALRLSPRPVGLMQAYLDDPARTDAAMAGGFYRTGDEARRDEDGYVYFVGRGDDVFKSSDYRISPFELESVLLEHAAVAEAAVVPSPDAVRLSVPKAFLALRPGVDATAETARSIFAMCTTKLAPYKRVRRIEFAELPKTISGKIRRVDLRRREAGRRAANERGPHEHWIDDKSEAPGLWRTGFVILGQLDLVALPPDTALATLATRYRAGSPALDAFVEACAEVRAAPPPPNAKQRIAFVVQLAALAGEALRPFAGRWVLDAGTTFGVVYALGEESVDLFERATGFVSDPGAGDLDAYVRELAAARRFES